MTLLVLFFGTGACGLIYQQLWLRELSLVFGVTVQAVSTVLAAFFGGLALGGFLAGRWSRRTRRPVVWYGALEIGVGALAVLTPLALAGAGDLYVWFAKDVTGQLGVLTVVRFTLSFAVLVIPATLMGASLPLLASSSMLRSGRLGDRVGMLYASNTAGAVVGTVAAGFWLIGLWGVSRTFLLAALLNVGIGAAAVFAGWRWGADDAIAADDLDATSVERSTDATTTGSPIRVVVLSVFAVSGFVTLALEVVWFRQLVLFLESSTYAFTVMLATVLVGIAVGSAVAAPVLRRARHPVRWLAAVEIVLGLAALGSFYMLSKSYSVVDRASDVVGASPLAVIIVASGLAMLPATLLMGFAFPFGIELWVDGEDDARGERVGTFYAVNVAAGIAGSLVAGFVMVPTIGGQASVAILSLAILASGLWLAWYALPARQWLVSAGSVAVLAAIVIAVLLPDPYDSVMIHRFPGERVIWKADDAQTTVSIQQSGDFRVMYVDGQHQANNTPEMVAYHRLLGTLPVAIHPDPRSALVIGLGGGVSPGALSGAPGVDVTVVELSPEVVEGAEYLSDVNDDVTRRGNVEIKVDDGRNHMLVTDERYDIITADVILPTHAGAGKLWSVEYWELTRRALAPGGITVQWVPQEHTRDYQMIVRSFLEVFPNTTVWASGSMLIGSDEPLHLDRAALETKLSDPTWAALLGRVGITSWDAFTTFFTADSESVRSAIGDGDLLTDDHPRLEYYRTLPPAGTGWDPTSLPVSPVDALLD